MKKDINEETKAAVTKERERILTLILKNAAPMAADYREVIRKTGGLLTTSMTYAYSKGIQDILKLIVKDGEHEDKEHPQQGQ